MKLLRDLRRLSFRSPNRSSDSTDSSLATNSSPALSSSLSINASPSQSPVSSADTSPPSSFLALPDLAPSDNLSMPLSFAPIIINFPPPDRRHIVHVTYPVVIFDGFIPQGPKPDGRVTLRHYRNPTPSTDWLVFRSKFKAVVPLVSGINDISLEYVPEGSKSSYTSIYKIIYEPMLSAPPIRLVVLHTKDSIYAQPDPDVENEQLNAAKAKYRIAACLWQSFMAESMNRANHQRRTFQLESSYEQSTLYTDDLGSDKIRSQPLVHVVELDKTVAEMNDMSQADMPAYIESALKKTLRPSRAVKTYYACVMLDSEWDKTSQVTTGAASFGGKGDIYDINMAIIGGHTLSTYPMTLNEVGSAVIDDTATPGFPEASKVKNASVGMGAHLKLIGKMLGLPEQEYGIMGEDFKRFGNFFSTHPLHGGTREACLHPLDAIRLRFHPVFKVPSHFGPPVDESRRNTGLIVWAVSDNVICLKSRIGIGAVEIWKPNDRFCHHWTEHIHRRAGPSTEDILLDLTKIANSATPSSMNRRTSVRSRETRGPLSLKVITADGSVFTIPSAADLCRNLAVTLPNRKRPVTTNLAIGSAPLGAEMSTAVFPGSTTTRMLAMKVFHTSSCINGVEFSFDDSLKETWGSCNPDASFTRYPLNVGAGEMLMGLEVAVLAASGGVCGIRVHTNAGRVSHWFGAASLEGGATSHMLIPPAGFRCVGLRGDTFESELHSVQMLIDHQ